MMITFFAQTGTGMGMNIGQAILRLRFHNLRCQRVKLRHTPTHSAEGSGAFVLNRSLLFRIHISEATSGSPEIRLGSYLSYDLYEKAPIK